MNREIRIMFKATNINTLETHVLEGVLKNSLVRFTEKHDVHVSDWKFIALDDADHREGGPYPPS